MRPRSTRRHGLPSTVLSLALSLVLMLGAAAVRAQADPADALFTAIARDDASTLSTLFLRGADPNQRDAKGQTALTLAIRAGHERAAGQLLGHPDIRVDLANAHGETPLMMAALRGQLAWMRQLIDRGAAVQREGWSPLHYAASGPSVEAVRLLLERGAVVDARSPNGSTALMLAARYGDEAAVRLLLARGADAQARNELGLDAAEFARLGGREALAQALRPR